MITVLASLFGVTLTTLLTTSSWSTGAGGSPTCSACWSGRPGSISAPSGRNAGVLEAEKPETIPISELLRRHPLEVLLALGISIISNASFYILAYIPTYGVKTLHLPQSAGFTATLVGGLILAIGCPLAGHWSDRLPRPLLMVVTCWLFVLTPYPAFYLMAAWPSLATCVFAVAWLHLSRPATAAYCRH